MMKNMRKRMTVTSWKVISPHLLGGIGYLISSFLTKKINE
jgi:hypothetical protein